MRKMMIFPVILIVLLLNNPAMAAQGDTKLVSVDSTGSQANDESLNASISADGIYVAFVSAATNLVAGDTNGFDDIFIHNTQTATTTRASVDSAGVQADGGSYNPSISADGVYVAFVSAATNLVAGDTNGFADVFIHDTQTGTTTRISVDSAGNHANGDSDNPAISADGRYVAFTSIATNLVTGDTNGFADVFIHDTQTGTTTRASVDSAGNQADNESAFPSISADGRYVAFASIATNLVTGDTNAVADVFIHDTQTGTTTRVSVDSAGNEADGDSAFPSISANGRYVAFASIATDLVAGDINGVADVFIHDIQSGSTTRASVDSAGNQADGNSGTSSISADGRYVAFVSEATSLVAGDTNAVTDVFIRDTHTGSTTRASVDSAGSQADDHSGTSSISADGRYVAFISGASNLVANDTNAVKDIFVHQYLPDAESGGGGSGGGCFLGSIFQQFSNE